MLIHKIIYIHPFVLVQPIALVEFKTYAPIVAIRKFNAPRLMAAIIDYVEYRSFTSVDLIEYADVVTHYSKKAEELRLAIGGMDALELGNALKSIKGEDFGGFRLKKDGRDMDGTIWRIYQIAPSR